MRNKEDKSLIFKGFRHGNIYLVDFSSNDASLATCLDEDITPTDTNDTPQDDI